MGESSFTISLAEQTLWFGWSLALGCLIMLIYTVFRSMTRHIKKAGMVVTVDILFFLVVAALEFVFITLLPMNTLRWFHLAGQVVGAILFWISLAPVVVKTTSVILDTAYRCFVTLKMLFAGKVKRKKQETKSANNNEK